MPFDANLVLRDGTVDLISTEAAPTALAATAGTDGAKCIDLGTTTRPRGNAEGVIHLTATLVLPTVPTTYAEYMDLDIQQSDNLTFGYETIASFPRLYTYTRLLNVTVVTAFAAGDINVNLSGSVDNGIIRWMHPDLLTIGKTAKMIVAMAADTDTFDIDTDPVDADGGTGDGTLSGASIVEASPRLGGPGSHTRVFGVYKRYIRGEFTVHGGNFGKAHLLLSPYPFRTL